MLLLALDCATETCGVAFALDGVVKAELTLNTGHTHTRTILKAVRAVLDVCGVEMAAIDCFAVTRGPGSFTGMRIGISSVKGLALALDKPIIGISSLDVIANQAPVDARQVCAIMDARRKEVYWSAYRREDTELVRQGDERVERAEMIGRHVDGGCLFIGNGVPEYRDVLTQTVPGARFASEVHNAIRPAVLARLAWRRFKQGQPGQADALMPVYLRLSDAERKRLPCN